MADRGTLRCARCLWTVVPLSGFAEKWRFAASSAAFRSYLASINCGVRYAESRVSEICSIGSLWDRFGLLKPLDSQGRPLWLTRPLTGLCTSHTFGRFVYADSSAL